MKPNALPFSLLFSIETQSYVRIVRNKKSRDQRYGQNKKPVLSRIQCPLCKHLLMGKLRSNKVK